jgi:hypothetical protein
MQTPIVVTGEVKGLDTLPVVAPVNGWASGRYALLKTPTAGLKFALEDVEDVKFSEAVESGIVTYYASLDFDDEVPIVCEDEDLSAGAKNQIRKLLGDSLVGIREVKVRGPKNLVGLIADMGIAPSFAVNNGILNATYTLPEIRIVSFDPQTGVVRIRVIPGEGNTIVSEIATGYLHVYGTDNLAKEMSRIEKVGYDLTPYLKDSTKGEASLTVTLGTHTFLKVKVEK